MSIKSSVTNATLREIEKITGGKLTLGKLLHAIRESEDETLVKFSENLGISKQHLCDIEHERKLVSPKLAAEYANKLGFSKEQFIRLSIQDALDRDGLNVIVDISHKTKNKRIPLIRGHATA